MPILILTGIGTIFALGAVSILLVQNYKVRKGAITINDEYNGPEAVSAMIHLVIRYGLKRSVHFRKFSTQYFFHIMVRVMYYLDLLTSKLYSSSRRWFVRNAVRNKGTVPHFWEHLKVYKQEMDQERDKEDGVR